MRLWLKNTLATFRLPIKQIIPLLPHPEKKLNTLYIVLLISSGKWKQKKQYLGNFGGGGGGGEEQGVLLKVIKNEYFLEETGCGKRTPR